MSRSFRPSVLPSLVSALILGAATVPPPASGQATSASSYDDLVELFHEWRAFEAPRFVDGVPDYTADAMRAQHAALPRWQARLAEIDPSTWPVPQRIDWQMVEAEMNGLDFNYRVLRPWARDPAFYVWLYPSHSDVPTQAGPAIDGEIELWSYHFPLSADDAAELARRIRAVPGLLAQARVNLKDSNARDLWTAGIPAFAGQSADLAALGKRAGGTSAELDAAITAAQDATDEFRAWLQDEAPSKTGPSGIGRENYDWYLRNVHLSPYSWDQLVTLMRSELTRAWSSLLLEEHRNRDLPKLERIDDAAEYERRMRVADSEFLRFLSGIQTMQPWMEPALRAQDGHYVPAKPGELRNFFSEASYRDPLTMRTHEYHWIELARLEKDPNPSPIRSATPLYNMYDQRSEGLATAMEEWGLHAGLFDRHPRSKELIWILLAERAARALGGLYMHANVWDMDQAVAFQAKKTPRGWLPPGAFARSEQTLYLRQPGYGVSYIAGKVEIEQVMAKVGERLRDDFTMKRFLDPFLDCGVIPVSLIQWQMTGEGPAFLDTDGG